MWKLIHTSSCSTFNLNHPFLTHNCNCTHCKQCSNLQLHQIPLVRSSNNNPFKMKHPLRLPRNSIFSKGISCKKNPCPLFYEPLIRRWQISQSLKEKKYRSKRTPSLISSASFEAIVAGFIRYYLSPWLDIFPYPTVEEKRGKKEEHTRVPPFRKPIHFRSSD